MKGKPAPPGMMNINTEALAKMMRQSSTRDRMSIEILHRELEHAYKDALTLPQATPAGVMLGIYALVDEAVTMQMTRPDAERVSCKRGCSACCYLHVTVTKPEAQVMLDATADAGLVLDHERLHRQAEKHDDTEWRQLPYAQRRCVFLNDAGECGIYEYRPLACRRYFVVSDPADCDTFLKPGQEVLNFVSARAEIASSAALETFASGTLARMMLAEIEKEGAARP